MSLPHYVESCSEMKSYKELLHYTTSNITFDRLTEKEKEEMISFLWQITIKACREDFYTFVLTMAPVLIPGFKTGRHIEIICKELQDLYEAIKRNDKTKSKLQVFLPPESMKTVLCSHLFPVWLLGKMPMYRVIAVAHSGDHAGKELGGNAKRITQLPEYQEIFPKMKISSESPGTAFWKTTKGGYYFSAGWGTQLPGKRCNLLLGDDIVSEHTKPSEISTINENYASGAESRMLEDNSAQLIVNTRWYPNDISGYLEDRDGGITPNGIISGSKQSDRPWRIIKVPALLDPEAVALLSQPGDKEGIYKVGGSYWPERKSIENILDAKRRLTPHQWQALMLQDPMPADGSIFKRDMFKEWKIQAPPEVSNVVISLDTAYSEKETKDAAESVYEIWGIFPMKETTATGEESMQGNMILLGYDKGYWSFPELKEKCFELMNEYRDSLDFFLIEDRASGISLIQELRNVGIPVIAYQPDKDKVSRAHAASAHIYSGRVWTNPNLDFSNQFLSEVMKFPAAGKDTTDAFTQAVLWMKDNWLIIPEDYSNYGSDSAYRYGDNVTPIRKKARSYWNSAKRD
jgi:predicted phage terminase large subunit-like protein